MEGAPPSPPAEVGFVDPNLRNLVAEVSTKSIRTYNEGGDKPTIVAIDCGMKHNIVRYFVETHDVTLIVVPFDYDLEANPSDSVCEMNLNFRGRGDGVHAMPRRRDAVEAAVRESTHLVREPRPCRDTVCAMAWRWPRAHAEHAIDATPSTRPREKSMLSS